MSTGSQMACECKHTHTNTNPYTHMRRQTKWRT